MCELIVYVFAQAPPGTKAPTKVARKSATGVASAGAPASNGLSNGDALKPPPSPPLADNALLPDVIA